MAISESSATVLSTLVFSDLWLGFEHSFGSVEKLIQYHLCIILYIGDLLPMPLHLGDHIRWVSVPYPLGAVHGGAGKSNTLFE